MHLNLRQSNFQLILAIFDYSDIGRTYYYFYLNIFIFGKNFLFSKQRDVSIAEYERIMAC